MEILGVLVAPKDILGRTRWVKRQQTVDYSKQVIWWLPSFWESLVNDILQGLTY
jgi:hypothetical protein